MRIQQTITGRINYVLSVISVFCTRSTSSLAISFEHQMKDRPHFTRRRSTWTMDQAGSPRTDIYVFHSFDCDRHKDEGSSVIAQPMFVFKKERPYKRPAEDPVYKTENVPSGCSRKRARVSYSSFQSSDSQSYRETVCSKKQARTSSFIVIPTFPPSQPSLPTSTRQRDVLRPAILQLPQVTACRMEKKRTAENPLEENHEADNQMSEDTYSCIDISKKPPLPLQISSSSTTHNPLPKDRTFSDSEHSNFVFGENIVERVLKPEKSPELQSKDGQHISEKEPLCTPDFHTISPWATPFFAKGSTLAESAAAYLSSKTAQRYLLEKIEITTGEEAEHNVLQINCRLFLFNKALLSWTERGSGSLRLNDTSSNQHGMLQSRLVMRNQGSMRLILNTKLWTQMVIERANRKSVCITATDLEDGSVKVFLIQASTKDTDSLYAAIHHRLVALRNFMKQQCGINQVEYKLDVQPVSCDSDDEENEKRAPGSNNRSEHSPWIRRQPVVCS